MFSSSHEKPFRAANGMYSFMLFTLVRISIPVYFHYVIWSLYKCNIAHGVITGQNRFNDLQTASCFLDQRTTIVRWTVLICKHWVCIHIRLYLKGHFRVAFCLCFKTSRPRAKLTDGTHFRPKTRFNINAMGQLGNGLFDFFQGDDQFATKLANLN